MPAQTWEVLLNAYEFSGNEKGAELTGTEVETAISPGAVEPGQACSIPPNYLKVGTILRVTAAGILTTAAEATPLTLGLKLIKPGEAATTGVFLVKILMKSSATAKTNATWLWETTTRVTATSKTAKAVTQGKFHGFVGVSNSETEGISTTMIPALADATAGQSENFESGAEKQLILVAKAGKTTLKMTTFQWLIEALN